MFVYSVYQWERHEGGHTISIHKTKRGAFKAVREYIAKMCSHRYFKDDIWSYQGGLVWSNELDCVAIFMYHVEE